MTSFDFRLPTRIVFGPGRLRELGELSRSLGDIERALVVSDPGVIGTGHTERGIESLNASGIATELFDEFHENPTTTHVDAGYAVAREFRPNLIVGLGGGSSMDCAKGINFVYSCGGSMRDYRGVGKATGPLLPMIAVPTTSGTGSETQSFALISDAETKTKMACGDKRAAFRIALLDPELTLTQPARVTALTGFDAMTHAVETAVTTARTPLSLAFSREAWRHLAPNYLKVISSPHDVVSRGEMQLGACFAGLAIENSMLGAGHAAANPLTAAFGVSHGEAVAMMLPHVVRRNGRHVNAAYQELLSAMLGDSGCPGPESGAEGLADFLSSVAAEAGLTVRLGELGVPSVRLPQLAADAAEQWTGGFNPVPLDQDDYLQLYQLAM